MAEIKVAVERTGGLVVLAESFGHSVFKDSFKRVFETGANALGLSFKYDNLAIFHFSMLLGMLKFSHLMISFLCIAVEHLRFCVPKM